MILKIQARKHMVEKLVSNPNPKKRGHPVKTTVVCDADPIEVELTIPQPKDEMGKKTDSKVVKISCNSPESIIDAIQSEINLHKQDIIELFIDEINSKPKSKPKPEPKPETAPKPEPELKPEAGA